MDQTLMVNGQKPAQNGTAVLGTMLTGTSQPKAQHGNGEIRLRVESLSKDNLPLSIMEIPSVWLKRSEAELREYPNLPLLAQPHTGPSRLALRCFLVAEMVEDGKIKNSLRLGSFGSDSNVCHIMLAIELLEDVEKISPACTVESLRGGFIAADYDNRIINIQSKHGAYPAADLELTSQLLRDGLRPEYKGYGVHLRLDGEYKYEINTVIE